MAVPFLHTSGSHCSLLLTACWQALESRVYISWYILFQLMILIMIMFLFFAYLKFSRQQNTLHYGIYGSEDQDLTNESFYVLTEEAGSLYPFNSWNKTRSWQHLHESHVSLNLWKYLHGGFFMLSHFQKIILMSLHSFNVFSLYALNFISLNWEG